MGSIEFDGIYGEADTWLSADEVRRAELEAIAEILKHPKPNENGIADLDDQRRRH